MTQKWSGHDQAPERASTPLGYEIRVAGSLSDRWSDWFEGLSITCQKGETRIRGLVADQAALYGLLRKVRDTGMTLIAVNQIDSEEE